MIRRITAMAGAALLAAIACASCTDNTPTCVPATTIACFCATGDPGQQVCRPDGQRYDDCTCLPDAGVDAATNASADAATTSSGSDLP